VARLLSGLARGVFSRSCKGPMLSVALVWQTHRGSRRWWHGMRSASQA